MEITTKVYQEDKKWNADSRIPLDFENREGKAVLNLSTRKDRLGHIHTHASVDFVTPDKCLTHMYPTDFAKTVRRTPTKVLGSQNRIAEFHEETLRLIDDIKTEALKHYGR